MNKQTKNEEKRESFMLQKSFQKNVPRYFQSINSNHKWIETVHDKLLANRFEPMSERISSPIYHQQTQFQIKPTDFEIENSLFSNILSGKFGAKKNPLQFDNFQNGPSINLIQIELLLMRFNSSNIKCILQYQCLYFFLKHFLLHWR